jgi:hypothetical protein
VPQFAGMRDTLRHDWGSPNGPDSTLRRVRSTKRCLTDAIARQCQLMNAMVCLISSVASVMTLGRWIVVDDASPRRSYSIEPDLRSDCLPHEPSGDQVRGHRGC